MSRPEMQCNPSQDREQPPAPVPPPPARAPVQRKPLPFDDDDTGTAGNVTDTTNPKIEGFAGSVYQP
ncbi:MULTISPECIES: hypothetical protein [unclassified Corallococcus]|uniref:hypothetical protein n=1 Tax=unclassified Corallococcus TaxID=2685029 RepID=UPI001A8EB12D|nr:MULTISPECIES: hypothetical protein [unclassified Corallococcus]MBN9684346.1 hypothetical protein [Corallococcus sp. NCSPR001]WAS84176.1 hypothetical protein O0N60_33405 [Corallococcus sp. NCRR]